MAKHLSLAQAKESTYRAVRTFLQGCLLVLGVVALVAIPPVEDAVNSLLHLVSPTATLPPGLAVSVGLVSAALTAVVTKIWNVVEGVDRPTSVTEAAEALQELTALIEAAKSAGKDTVDLILKPKV